MDSLHTNLGSWGDRKHLFAVRCHISQSTWYAADGIEEWLMADIGTKDFSELT